MCYTIRPMLIICDVDYFSPWTPVGIVCTWWWWWWWRKLGDPPEYLISDPFSIVPSASSSYPFSPFDPVSLQHPLPGLCIGESIWVIISALDLSSWAPSGALHPHRFIMPPTTSDNPKRAGFTRKKSRRVATPKGPYKKYILMSRIHRPNLRSCQFSC